MVLEEILRQETGMISNRKIPKAIELNYSTYCELIKEIGASRYFSQLHGINILITNTNRIIVR